MFTSPPAGSADADSTVEDAHLLLLELELVEHSGLLQRAELLELGQLVVHVGSGCRSGRRGWGVRLGRLLLLLLGPAAGLTSGDPVRHCGRGAGDGCGPCDTADESWHGCASLLRGLGFSGLSGIHRREQGLDR